ncbi:MAG: hypothetical protein WA637_18255 [Terriglobales bacterium]
MGPSTLKLLPLFTFLLASAALANPNIPNFSDLTIKMRRNDSVDSAVETLYLKGSKRRREYSRDKPSEMKFVSISRCDERKKIVLNEDAKLYAELPITDWSEQRKRAPPLPPTEMTGADVTITIDSIDTGERRPQGAYVARHVKIRTTVESGPGAAMPSSKEERDGWYIDLPSVGCEDSSQRTGFVYAMLTTGGRHDRIHFKRLGTAPAGFPLEETTTKTEQGKSTVSKLELLEFSDSPLDDSLFQVPKGYSPAVSTPHGGYDMTRPETLANRVQVYWAELRDWTKHWF